MEWKDLQPTLTFLAAIIAASISSFTLWKLQNKKRDDDMDLKAFGHSLDKKLKEFESTLIEKNAYLIEKGKGAASKEDVEEVTRKVESTRVAFLSTVEVLKADLSKKTTLHKLQAEKEFEVYSEIWDKAITLKFALQELRPAMDTIDPNEPPEERWNRRYKKVREAFSEFTQSVEKQRPFYPEKSYQELQTLSGEVWNEIVDFEFSFEEDQKWKMPVDGYRRAMKNLAEIIKRMDIVCELIRNRISEN
jgi:hypothetical protein